jgi:hypothetical protein
VTAFGSAEIREGQLGHDEAFESADDRTTMCPSAVESKRKEETHRLESRLRRYLHFVRVSAPILRLAAPVRERAHAPFFLNIASTCNLLASSKSTCLRSIILLTSVNVRSSNPALASPSMLPERLKVLVENPVQAGRKVSWEERKERKERKAHLVPLRLRKCSTAHTVSAGRRGHEGVGRRSERGSAKRERRREGRRRGGKGGVGSPSLARVGVLEISGAAGRVESALDGVREVGGRESDEVGE